MKWIFIFLFNWIFFYSSFAQNLNKDSTFFFPKSIGFVNDFENVLSEKHEKKLSKKLQSFEIKTSNEIAIVSIESYFPYASLKEYTIDLANTWGVGKEEFDNGITIVFGKNIKEIYIANGFGIELKMTDIETKDILETTILHYFKKEKYYKGLKKGIEQIFIQIQ